MQKNRSKDLKVEQYFRKEMAIHSIGDNLDLLRSMHGNGRRQQHALIFSTELNKLLMRAFHISHLKIDIPK